MSWLPLEVRHGNVMAYTAVVAARGCEAGAQPLCLDTSPELAPATAGSAGCLATSSPTTQVLKSMGPRTQASAARRGRAVHVRPFWLRSERSGVDEDRRWWLTSAALEALGQVQRRAVGGPRHYRARPLAGSGGPCAVPLGGQPRGVPDAHPACTRALGVPSKSTNCSGPRACSRATVESASLTRRFWPPNTGA